MGSSKRIILTLFNRKFEDAKGIFYPPCVNLLVIVEKRPTNKRESWFPFKLNLEWTLKVGIHKHFQSPFDLEPWPDRHAGWCFQIKGEWEPNTAQRAIEDAKTSDAMLSVVGLHAAVKAWICAQSRYDNCQYLPHVASSKIICESPASKVVCLPLCHTPQKPRYWYLWHILIWVLALLRANNAFHHIMSLFQMFFLSSIALRDNEVLR